MSFDPIEIGDRRTNLHRGVTRNVFSGNPRSHHVGMAGEYAFSEWSGEPADLSDRIKGDDGWDFNYKGIVTVDVHAVEDHPKRRPWILKQPVNTSNTYKPDVLFLCVAFMQERRVKLMGWEFIEIVEQSPQRKFLPDGPMNYVIDYRCLRPKEDLINAPLIKVYEGIV